MRCPGLDLHQKLMSTVSLPSWVCQSPIHRQTSLSCFALAIAITEISWPSHQIICRSGIGSPLSIRPHNCFHFGAFSLSVPFSLPRGFILLARRVKKRVLTMLEARGAFIREISSVKISTGAVSW